MITIQELVSRIKWDTLFGAAAFEIGYLDRVEGRIVRVDLDEIIFREGESFSFQVVGTDGVVVTIPFHRVREVFRDEELIWKRLG